MEAIRRNCENPMGVSKPKPNPIKGIRKPLGITNRVLNVQTKPSFKEKAGLSGALKEKQVLKPVRVTRSLSIKKVEILEKNLPELSKNLPTVEEALEPIKIPDNVENIDADDVRNPQLLSQYVNDIYRYIRSLEVECPIKKNHLQGQPEVTGKMRAVLMDWLIQVHQRFSLLQETLYMTIAIIDRFLQIEKVKRTELQLVGVTAMFIASKFEEMYAPEVGDFVYITDNTYTKQEILCTERLMLKKLNFNLSRPLPLHFLRRISKAGNVDAQMHTLSKYVMEIAIPEYDLAHLAPSLLAAAAAYLSLQLLSEIQWSDTLEFYSGYGVEQILPVVQSLCRLLLKASSCKLQAVHSKYASSKLMKISLLPELKSDKLVQFAK